MGPHGSKNFKTLHSSYKSNFSNFSWIFFPMVLTKFRFWNLKTEILPIFLFSLTWDPMGVQIPKRYSCKSQPKVFKHLLSFPPNEFHKTALGIFEILSFWFVTIVFRKFQMHHCTLWRNQKPQLSGKERSQSKKEWNLGLVGTSSTYIVTVPLIL